MTRIWRSSVGKKYIMAISGCLLLFFVIAHLLGNLQIFLGPETLNRYGYFLQSNHELVWPARVALLVLVALHVAAAVKLAAENRAARPTPYAGNPAPVVASYASRTMMMSGLIIAAFVIYHLLHFTVQVQSLNLTGKDFLALHDEQGRHDVYAMMVFGFQQPLVSGFYVLGMALLCIHLSHGAYAMFQSAGWTFGCCAGFPKSLARWASLFIFLGYVSIPAAVMSGLGKSYVERLPRVIVAEKEVEK